MRVVGVRQVGRWPSRHDGSSGLNEWRPSTSIKHTGSHILSWLQLAIARVASKVETFYCSLLAAFLMLFAANTPIDSGKSRDTPEEESLRERSN